MIINKETLNKVKYLEITLLEGETFVIYSKNIVDLKFEIQLEDNEYYSISGFIEFDKTAQNVVENDFNEDATFSEYLDSYTDIYTITLHSENGSHLRFFTEYDPIISVKSLEPINFSNCPSLEFLPNGNMLVLFGNLSKNNRRIDNNYSKISNYSPLFNDYLPELFEVKVDNFTIEENASDINLLAKVTILNEDTPLDNITLKFINVEVENLNKLLKEKNIEGEFNYFIIEGESVYISISESVEFFCQEVKIL